MVKERFSTAITCWNSESLEFLPYLLPVKNIEIYIYILTVYKTVQWIIFLKILDFSTEVVVACEVTKIVKLFALLDS